MPKEQSHRDRLLVMSVQETRQCQVQPVPALDRLVPREQSPLARLQVGSQKATRWD